MSFFVATFDVGVFVARWEFSPVGRFFSKNPWFRVWVLGEKNPRDDPLRNWDWPLPLSRFLGMMTVMTLILALGMVHRSVSMSYRHYFDAFDVSSAFLTKLNTTGFLFANQSRGAHGHAGKQRSLDSTADEETHTHENHASTWQSVWALGLYHQNLNSSQKGSSQK